MKPKITIPKTNPTLKTECLELKPPLLSDAADFFEIRSNVEFMKYVGQ
ncbi:GNAT family N-acetyltransferase [Vicingaceae bacterium]|nr:GNAT family N-acetyltransferase [Vicingaceae bacterium]MDB4082763.1 GNAT family N-acetyltransferase [Vicingaceae bacterium]MDC1451004.1 GNAT family N-acetyltransferase [Vicingaceae bacterium]